MGEEAREKLLQKAKNIRYLMIFYVTCMLLLQIFAYSKVDMFWMVLVGLITSIPSWMIYVKYGLFGVLSAMFSLRNYDVYVNGVKSDSKKAEMQGDRNLIQLVIMLGISAAGVATTGILLLFNSATLLIQALVTLKNDKVFGKQLLKSLGLSWIIPVITFILLTIWINIIL